jgi:hypothetical protein
MPTEVRSPWSRERGESHPRLAESLGSRSSPSNARADGGHRVHTIGKSGHQPASATRDGVTPKARPVVGGNRSPFDPSE